MRLLLDTNIFLEVLLAQSRAPDARRLLAHRAAHEFFLSDFSLHSIGLLLFREKRHAAFQEFVADVVERLGMGMLTLSLSEIGALVTTARRFHLDFDDAYQYTLAAIHNLTLVSFDDDFDRTDKKRKTPAQLL